MRIFTEENWHKVSNFINYIIEHFQKKGEHYKIKLKAEDIYDKRLINKRTQSLQGKLLLQHEDEFEIVDANFENLKENFPELIQELKITEKNFTKQLVHFELSFIDTEEFAHLSFSFLK
ncbi:MAG: hypothetical protein DRJ10_15565 [Bacteroidetes bacterium]|nr:MAG: hypothetical protein DRJ10_15565 [Bacteroidota bacterium]